ncbi:MAG: FAD-binding oxidoreductase [Acidimicrobiia bacterium]|nr:FAD-binding oxidoreductase [Acidimicrobiia bacterium]
MFTSLQVKVKPMPTHSRDRIVVVGGGAVGLCSALFLLRRGYKATVIDRGPPGDGASGHNAGIIATGHCLPTALPGVIRSLPKMLLDPLSPLAVRWRYLPRMLSWLLRFLAAGRPSRVEEASIAITSLIEQSVRAWEELVPVGGTEGAFAEGGYLLGYLTEATYRKDAFSIETTRRRQVPMRVLDQAGVAELAPTLSGRFSHGVWFPNAVWGDPRRLCTRLHQLFSEAGGETIRSEVVGFEVGSDGVSEVRTQDGAIPADGLVIAAGAWSKSLTAMLGFTTPLDTERGYGVDLPDPGVELPFPILSKDFHFALTPLPQGLRLAGTDELAGLEAPPNFRRADRLIEASRQVFPELNPSGAERWMSFRPSHPDSLPVIGRAPGYNNVFLAYGHDHVGLTQAAITGEIVARLVDSEEPTVDIYPFRPTRFRFGRP